MWMQSFGIGKAAVKTLLAAGLWATLAARAVVIPESFTTVALPGTTLALRPALAGETIDQSFQDFAFVTDSGPVGGTLWSSVVRTDAGTLDFYWRLQLTSGRVNLMEVRYFDLPTYDVDWRADTPGDSHPSSAFFVAGSGIPGDRADYSVVYFRTSRRSTEARPWTPSDPAWCPNPLRGRSCCWSRRC